jgi:hypothetical protein
MDQRQMPGNNGKATYPNRIDGPAIVVAPRLVSGTADDHNNRHSSRPKNGQSFNHTSFAFSRLHGHPTSLYGSFL